MPVPVAVDLPVQSPVVFEAALPLDSSQLAAPMVLEGTVDTFDPVARAASLASSMPRQWCGSYRSFTGGAVQPVEVTLASVQPMGQMVVLRGDMRIGETSTPVQGNLNAKSDQLDLLPLADPLTAGLEPGGSFLGLQGATLAGWVAPRMTYLGGRLNLAAECASSEALPIRGLW